MLIVTVLIARALEPSNFCVVSALNVDALSAKFRMNSRNDCAQTNHLWLGESGPRFAHASKAKRKSTSILSMCGMNAGISIQVGWKKRGLLKAKQSSL